MTRRITALIVALLICSPLLAAEHGVAMHGEPKYGPEFQHFDYVNPDAPRGGTLSQHVIGTFDTLNSFQPKGSPAAGTGYLYDSLTVQSEDEPFSQYGLLAESMEIAEDDSWVIYNLRPEARFADGHPVTAEDVVFSFNTLMEKGRPFFSYYYADVKKVEAVDDHTVRFSFSGDMQNRELPLIVGQLQVLPSHYWSEHDFTQAGLQPPLGSGPYEVSEVKAGKRIVYQRRDDYWGKDLPVNRGRYNFDRLVFEYFLDETVALEAFKGGEYNFRDENNSKYWATAYESPALKQGKIVKQEVHHSRPQGMQGFVYNTRRELFQDRTLRRALILAFDFEWSNKHLFYGQYERTRSYFQNSELAATGLPSKEELELLEPWRDELPAEVFEQSYQPPTTDGSGRPRENLRRAQEMLREAGYSLNDGVLMSPGGKPVTFEILLFSAAFERIVLPYARNLKALGVQAEVRRVDQPQYIERLKNFDYDMIVNTFAQSSSPGNEQRRYWHSDSADTPGSRNYIGISDPVIDDLVDKVISAPSREALITRCRALDRVLQWGYYVVPHWHVDYFRLAYTPELMHPDDLPPYSVALDAWWHRGDRKP
jgi:microcin C transport system substrate-binding protein